jgi:hypothetical protein
VEHKEREGRIGAKEEDGAGVEGGGQSVQPAGHRLVAVVGSGPS